MIAGVKIKEGFSCLNFLPILVTSAPHPPILTPSSPPALTKISPSRSTFLSFSQGDADVLWELSGGWTCKAAVWGGMRTGPSPCKWVGEAVERHTCWSAGRPEFG